jgi:malonyl-CoA O-methyltransferase
MNTVFTLDSQRIYASFQRLGNKEVQNSVVSKTLGENLLQRLPALSLQPKVIVDLGAGSGVFTSALAQHYPQSLVIAVDYAPAQLHRAVEPKGAALCARAELLPFADNSIDLLFCHLMLHWCAHPEVVIHEMQRVLKPNGVLLFSVLGPDSLQELRQSLLTLSDKPYLPSFTDMHHWGDLLQQAQFKNPVVDVEYFDLYYTDFSQLMQALRTQSPIYFLHTMNKGLITPRQWQRLETAYEAYRDEHGLVMTLEVVYGIAFGKALAPQDLHSQEASIPIQKVQRRR